MLDQKMNPIPDTWAVDSKGEPTTDPFKVNALSTNCWTKGIRSNDDG